MKRRGFVRLVALPLACACLLPAGSAVAQDKPQPVTVKDPVCGMKIDPAKAKGKTEHKGKTYYFCSDDCKTKFEKDPAQYADKEANPK
ncbi:MAG: YHS domain-containing protein [Acidobacteria bacterium]|nr:MAG: YHS domain-containing protein [Acidobacteriota bacterium]